VLTPRTKGFELVMQPQNRALFDYITDWTIVMQPNSIRVGTEENPLTVMDMFSKRNRDKLKIYCHVRKYKVSEIPQDSAKWLHQKFDEKEDLLEYFLEHEQFPGQQFVYQPEWGFLSAMVGLYLAIVGVLMYGTWLLSPRLLIGSLLFVFVTCLLVYVYEWKHVIKKVITKPKQI
jgi:hypothetical protein